jgi:hypothetical protein
MTIARTLRILLGAALWVAVGVCVVELATRESESGATTFSKVREHFTRDDLELEVVFDRPVWLEIGDPVLIDGGDTSPIGHVKTLLDDDSRAIAASFRRVSAARIVLFDRDRPRIHDDARLRLAVVPETAGSWVWKTLFNDDTLPRIREVWSRNDLLPHKDEIVAMAIPVLQGVLVDCRETLETETRPFLDRHRPQIDALVAKIEAELGKEELAKLFESEVWPVLHARLQPVLDEIGAEIWGRVPLWAFSWRAIYQSLPLTADDHFKKRWDTFVEEEVIPILKDHSADMIEVARVVAKDSLANPKVGAYLREFVVRMAGDPDFHRLGYTFVEEVFFQNPRFRERITERWRSDEVQKIVGFVSRKLEPTVREIGDIVLGTKESGITPEFARVLRTQVLERDRQRLFLDPGTADRPAIASGSRLEASIETETPR